MRLDIKDTPEYNITPANNNKNIKNKMMPSF